MDFPLEFDHYPHSQGSTNIPGLDLNTNSFSSHGKHNDGGLLLGSSDVNEKHVFGPAIRRARFRSFDSLHLTDDINQVDRIEDFRDFDFMNSYSPAFGGTEFHGVDGVDSSEQNNWNISSAFMAAREKFTQIASKIQSSYSAGRKALQESAELVRQNYDNQIVPSLLPDNIDQAEKSIMMEDPLNFDLLNPTEPYQEIFDMHSELSAQNSKRNKGAIGSTNLNSASRNGLSISSHSSASGLENTGCPASTILQSLNSATSGHNQVFPNSQVPPGSYCSSPSRTLHGLSSSFSSEDSSAIATGKALKRRRAMDFRTVPVPSPTTDGTTNTSSGHDEIDGSASSADSEPEKSMKLRRSMRSSRSRIRYRDEDYETYEEQVGSRPARKGRKKLPGSPTNSDKKKGLSSLESLLLQRGDPLKQKERVVELNDIMDSGDVNESRLVTPSFIASMGTVNNATQSGVPHLSPSNWVENVSALSSSNPIELVTSHDGRINNIVNMSSVDPSEANSLVSPSSVISSAETNPAGTMHPEGTVNMHPIDYYLSSAMTQSLMGADNARILMSQAEETQRQVLLSRMIQMLQADGYDPEELLNHIVEYKDLHASFGQKCWQALQSHLGSIRDLLCPDSITRMSLWTISHADGTKGERLPTQLLNVFRAATEKVRNQINVLESKKDDNAALDTTDRHENTPTTDKEVLPGIGVGVWAQVVSHCSLSETQQQKILTLSDTVRKRREHMISLFQKIDKLEMEITENFSETDQIMRDLTNLLTPEQVVRFYEFTERSKTLFDVVSSLRSWPMSPENEIRPSSSSNGTTFPLDFIPFQEAYAAIVSKISNLLGEQKKQQNEGQHDGVSSASGSSLFPGYSVWKSLSNIVGSALHEKAFMGLPHVPVSWVSHLVGNIGLGMGGVGNDTQQESANSNTGFFSAIGDFQPPKFALQTGLPDILALSSAGKALDAAAETAGLYVAKASAAAEIAANHAKHLSSAAADKAVTRAKQLSDTAASAASLFYSTVLGYAPGGQPSQGTGAE